MENKSAVEISIKNIEKIIDQHERELGELNTEIKSLKEIYNDRYNKTAILNTKLEERYKAQNERIGTLVESITNLVEEMRTSTSMYMKKFEDVEVRFKSIETNLYTNRPTITETGSTFIAGTGVQASETKTDDETNLSNKNKITVIIALIGLLEVFTRYVAPLIFN